MNRPTHARPVRRRATRRLAVTGLAAMSLLGACGDDDDTTATVSGDTSATSTSSAGATSSTAVEPAPVVVGGLEISGAWARTSPAMTTRGAVYLEITNTTDTDDGLVRASVDATVAARVELHETVVADEGATDDTAMGEMSTTTMGGGTGSTMGGSDMMTMQPVDRIAVPAGATAVLEPGGFHVMLIDLVAPLEVGTSIDVTLVFENAGEVVVTVEVRDTAP